MTGNGGSDTFLFSAPLTADNVDRITDFKPDVDTIELNSTFFNGLADGALPGNAFTIGNARDHLGAPRDLQRGYRRPVLRRGRRRRGGQAAVRDARQVTST